MITNKEVQQNLLAELNRRIANKKTSTKELKEIAETLTGMEASENMRLQISALASGILSNNNGSNNPEPKN